MSLHYNKQLPRVANSSFGLDWPLLPSHQNLLYHRYSITSTQLSTTPTIQHRPRALLFHHHLFRSLCTRLSSSTSGRLEALEQITRGIWQTTRLLEVVTSTWDMGYGGSEARRRLARLQRSFVCLASERSIITPHSTSIAIQLQQSTIHRARRDHGVAGTW